MENTVNWWSLLKRKGHLSEITEHDTPMMTWPVQFQGRRQSLPVYSVLLDVPCYRLSNGRTASRQLQFIEEHQRQGKDYYGAKVGDDFFSGDPDYLPALLAQHEILSDMIDACGLLATLRNGKQNEPLLIDRSGYVVNGNRRLCAMRKLVLESAETYSQFAHVEVAVLPSCVPEEIEELEAVLQIAEDTKMEYSWVDRAWLLRNRRALGWPPEKIAAFYKIGEDEVRQSILMLDYADRFLGIRNLARMYKKVEPHEQAFKEIVSQRKKTMLPTALDKDAFTEVAFLFLDDASPGRNYGKIKVLAKTWPQMVPELVSRLGVSSAPVLPVPSGGIGVLDQLIGEPTPATTTVNVRLLLDSLTSEESRNAAREILLDKLESMARTEDERRVQQNCAILIQRAQTALQDAMVHLRGGIENSEVAAVRHQLEQTASLVKDLQRILDEQHSS